MRTCETCLNDDAPFTKCRSCGPGLMCWIPKVAAQLVTKDKIIKGLVDACEAVLAYAKRSGASDFDGPEETRLDKMLRAAIAAAKEE